ncbi:MAG: family N-acetyltransferase [Myxococcales bacterium]|nr:family N-acetyltransferase [Myxococcales bacterium]
MSLARGRGRRPVAATQAIPSITLAPLRPAHAPAIVRWLGDPVVSANLGLRSRPTLVRTRAFIAGSNTAAVCARAILLGAHHVGTVVLDQIDRHIGRARLHIYIGDAEARGHGVGKRAVALALALAFDELDLHKVWLTVHERNAGAIRTYESVGFAIEGRHRSEFLLDGERVDELYMGVLRSTVQVRKSARRRR